MRDIRFRAWITEAVVSYKGKLVELPNEFSKKMINDVHSIHFPLEIITWQEIINGEKTNMSFTNDNTQIPSAQEFILMQFTGLKDKKGVEIYEGDIIISDYHVGGFSPFHQVVKYDSEYAGFYPFTHGQLPPEKDGFPYLYWANKYTVVIGNIYENPELLK